ncbi:hypothetical protein [Burkholderia sola]|uniref:hypothetical protein n=1 Tax=Burkholderia sola TaxID=2843302 RepID=UPI0023DD8454|nr:hypothetical protein [Burkholderia sola]MDF3083500.1 hypothetical protein [Burkholderia sola]
MNASLWTVRFPRYISIRRRHTPDTWRASNREGRRGIPLDGDGRLKDRQAERLVGEVGASLRRTAARLSWPSLRDGRIRAIARRPSIAPVSDPAGISKQ